MRYVRTLRAMGWIATAEVAVILAWHKMTHLPPAAPWVIEMWG